MFLLLHILGDSVIVLQRLYRVGENEGMARTLIKMYAVN